MGGGRIRVRGKKYKGHKETFGGDRCDRYVYYLDYDDGFRCLYIFLSVSNYIF